MFIFKRRRGSCLSFSFPIVVALAALWVPVKAETAPIAPIELVALGDSLIAGYGLAPGEGFVPRLQAALRARGHNVVVKNAGVSGDTSAAGLARLDWAIGRDTDAVIVELGANDMLRGIPPRVTQANLQAIVETLRARNIELLLAGMLAAPNLDDTYAAAFNPIYPDLARRYNVLLYPFFLDGVAAQRSLNLDDGIHPNRQGIDIIVAAILPQVEKLLGRVAAKSNP